MAGPVVRFRVDFTRNNNLGPGKIALLEAIRSSGSLSQAARELGMSYRRAWLLLASLNASFHEPVARATTGGRGGGGAALTAFGERLVCLYRRLERDICTLAARRLAPLLPAVAHRSSRKPAPLKATSVRRPLAQKHL